MKINKILKNVNKTPSLVFLVLLKDMIDFMRDIESFFKSGNTPHFDLWDFMIKLIITILLYSVLKSYIGLKRKFQIQNTISSIRNKNIFIRSFDGIEYFKTEFETDEQFFKRCPEGMYSDHLAQEYFYAKKFICEKFDLKPSEAEKELSKIYFIEGELNRNNK